MMPKQRKHGSKADKRIDVEDRAPTRVFRTPLEDRYPPVDIGDMLTLWRMRDPQLYAWQYETGEMSKVIDPVIAYTPHHACKVYVEAPEFDNHRHWRKQNVHYLRPVAVGSATFDVEWDFYAESIITSYAVWATPPEHHVEWFRERHPEAYHLMTTFDFANPMDPMACVEEWAWFVGRVCEYLRAIHR